MSATVARWLPLLCLLLAGCSEQPTSVEVWGGKGEAPGRFSEPFDLAVDRAGFVFVTDVRNHRVQKFTADGRFVAAFGRSVLEKPGGIGVAPDDTVWVTDYDRDRILHFSNDGRLLAAWGEAGDAPGEFASPVDVAVDGEGSVFVVDQYHHRIQQFTPRGRLIRLWGHKGKVNVVRSALNFLLPDGKGGALYYPSRIAVGGGRVYVSDAYNNRVQVFDGEGHFIRSFGGMGLWGGRFRVVSGIAVAAAGTLWVADFYNNRIEQFDREGNFLRALGGKGKSPGRFSGPTGVAVGSDGAIYIADWGNDRVQRLVP